MTVTPRYESTEPRDPVTDARGRSFQVARRHRAELLERIHAFERALATPAADPGWRGRAGRRLELLRAAFGQHVRVTEGEEGLYAELLLAAPRLARAVGVLVREHFMIGQTLEALADRLADPGAAAEQVRGWAGDLLREMSRHRQRGADLVYEAYAIDIGGET